MNSPLVAESDQAAGEPAAPSYHDVRRTYAHLRLLSKGTGHRCDCRVRPGAGGQRGHPKDALRRRSFLPATICFSFGRPRNATPSGRSISPGASAAAAPAEGSLLPRDEATGAFMDLPEDNPRVSKGPAADAPLSP